MARTMVAILFPALALLVTSPNSRRRNSEVFDGGFIVASKTRGAAQGELNRADISILRRPRVSHPVMHS
jgi:hypothetical protein